MQICHPVRPLQNYNAAPPNCATILLLPSKNSGQHCAHQIENVHFRRQHAIGNYIVDFCSPRQKLIIELDGGQHLEQQEYDQVRTEFLQAKGYRVLRFWNNDVLFDLNGVMKVILEALSPADEL